MDAIKATLMNMDKLERERDTARAECHDLNDLFELQLRADQRAVKRWREAHPGNEMTSPDRADLVVWLMGQLDEARAAYNRFVDAVHDQMPPLERELAEARAECERQHKGWTEDNLLLQEACRENERLRDAGQRMYDILDRMDMVGDPEKKRWRAAVAEEEK